MKVNNLELQAKIKDLLLNKVENLNWNYFDLDLNAAIKGDDVFETPENINQFFEAITPNLTGNYEYCSGAIEPSKVLKILFTIIDYNPKILPNIIRSLFKNNEIVNKSKSDEGFIGTFNRKNQDIRDDKFKELIRSGFRAKEDSVIILAEGDSWFQFPKIYFRDPVKDIIDWLMDDPCYAIKSLAAGGDWLSNIFYFGEYIEELPKLSPDVFLISGGGNDLVGNNRLALMVVSLRLEGRNDIANVPILSRLLAKRKLAKDIDIKKYERGLELVSKEFIKFLNVYFVQYFVFLHNIANHEKYRRMLIITQGYDFAIPYNGSRTNWKIFQRLVNNAIDTGRWLFEPLNMKGITDKDDQEAVVYTLIYEFNEMLIQLATFKNLRNVFHIDARGFAKEEDWFDELHLTSEAFEKVAETFKKCIADNIGMKEYYPKQKVYRVKDM